MKKIIIVSQSCGYIMTDVISAFVEKSVEVVFIYGWKTELAGELDSKVKQHKIIKYNKKNILTRILTWAIATVQIYFKLKKYKKADCEVLYVSNPPTSYFVASRIKLPFSILVFDAYPDALKNVGLKPDSWIYRWWAKKNQNIFPKAKYIFTLSEGMKSVLSNYVQTERVKVIPIWSRSELLCPIEKEKNIFIEQNNLQGKFIVLYSGNIGYTHNVEAIVDLAQKMKDYDDIVFLIIGDGLKKNMLVESVKERNLYNCMFLPFQSVDMLPYSLASADLGIVTLNDTTALLSVPSKTFNLMACGVPLLSIAPFSSELSRLITSYDNGRSFEKDDLDSMVKYIMELKNNTQLKNNLSENSLNAAKDFTSENAALFYKYLQGNTK